jgi:hypothetical protein
MQMQAGKYLSPLDAPWPCPAGPLRATVVITPFETFRIS